MIVFQSVAGPVDDHLAAARKGVTGDGANAGGDAHIDQVAAVGKGSAADGVNMLE